jgi:hypothetical protein
MRYLFIFTLLFSLAAFSSGNGERPGNSSASRAFIGHGIKIIVEQDFNDDQWICPNQGTIELNKSTEISTDLGIAMKIHGNKKDRAQYKELIKRMQKDCLGKILFDQLRSKFAYEGEDPYDLCHESSTECLNVYLNNNKTSKHNYYSCNHGNLHISGFYKYATNMFDPSAGKNGSCVFNYETMWIDFSKKESDERNLINTVIHELTHSAYSESDSLDNNEGEYCSHLAGWMAEKLMIPDNKIYSYPSKFEKSLLPEYSDYMTSCGSKITAIKHFEGKRGRISAYLGCQKHAYDQNDIWPSFEKCGSKDSKCCPFFADLKKSGCYKKFKKKMAQQLKGYSTPSRSQPSGTQDRSQIKSQRKKQKACSIWDPKCPSEKLR